jgi:hypothetical protein
LEQSHEFRTPILWRQVLVEQFHSVLVGRESLALGFLYQAVFQFRWQVKRECHMIFSYVLALFC